MPNVPFFKVQGKGVGNVGRLGTTTVAVIIGKMIHVGIQGFKMGEWLSNAVTMSLNVLSSPSEW